MLMSPAVVARQRAYVCDEEVELVVEGGSSKVLERRREKRRESNGGVEVLSQLGQVSLKPHASGVCQLQQVALYILPAAQEKQKNPERKKRGRREEEEGKKRGD